MRNLYNIIMGDYLQRSRSYAFLITLAVTIYAAHSFVPLPEAGYTTLTIPGYRGVYNSAWAGHISALMSTVILSLFGFYLINGAIKKDIDTKVGLIIASTSVTNFGYIFVKFLGNLMVLLTISMIALLVGILMFLIQNSGYPFHIGDFLRPYFYMVVPSLIIVSGLAILAEVFLSRKTILQNVLYFFIFTFMLSGMMEKNDQHGSSIRDGFGMGIVTNSIKDQVNEQFNENIDGVSLGYTINKKESFRTFEWKGVSWNTSYVLSRAVWIGFTLLLVYISSFFFHRFDFKQAMKSSPVLKIPQERSAAISYAGFQRSALPSVTPDYGISLFLKTELLLMVRKDSKWLWLLNIGLWLAMLFAPLAIAYVFLLPALLFLQVNRISDLTTKEVTNRLYYFTFASYKPLQRMLPAQILAVLGLLTILALPLILRLLLNVNFISVIQVLNGVVFIIALSVFLGILSGGKKLFEILFFLLTYAAFQAPQINYLGTIGDTNYAILPILLGTSILLLILSFMIRKSQIRNV
ncbi:hypothetical protein SAMN05444360_10450 [Chryseobacterium carnipullorum]|uniref:hypothetical protein n=1 Tax=Chryseobacterium carnipullorum TaxID=1124835 RepID=UPI00090FDA91|nr:hypothetical protein [Chryseobacterium carnipullorum]SHL74701.1 hypothetical protein SAMN05444360_10450 [Chryseobacterium carnipullorum]